MIAAPVPQLFTQINNLDIYRAFGNGIAITFDTLNDLIAGLDSAGVFCKMRKYFKLAECKIYIFSIQLAVMLFRIDQQ